MCWYEFEFSLHSISRYRIVNGGFSNRPGIHLEFISLQEMQIDHFSHSFPILLISFREKKSSKEYGIISIFVPETKSMSLIRNSIVVFVFFSFSRLALRTHECCSGTSEFAVGPSLSVEIL